MSYIEEKSFCDANEFLVSLDLPNYQLPRRAAWSAENWSDENFIHLANDIAKDVRNRVKNANDHLLVFMDTEHNKTLKEHITGTMCRPDIIAAFDCDLQGDIAWSCVRLVGEKASAGGSSKDQVKHANTYLYYLLLARPDLHIAQGLFTSKSGIIFLLGIGGIGVQTLSVTWNDETLPRLLHAFIYRLYDPAHFADGTYIEMDKSSGAYTICITPSQGSVPMICLGFCHIYAGNPFSTRTHVLSNAKPTVLALAVIKEQLCQDRRRFDELEILQKVHQPVRVPGVVQGVYGEVVTTPQSVEGRCKRRLGLSESGLPFTSIPTPRKMLETLFDLLEVLRYLYSERNVLHCDISSGNVLYVENSSSRTSLNPPSVLLHFAKGLLGGNNSQETSLLLVDFDHAEHLYSKMDGDRTGRTGTRIFIARAVEQGGPVKPTRTTNYVPEVPQSPECYALAHKDRIEKFPAQTEGYTISLPTAVGQSQVWRHNLGHDAESVFWLLVYWAVLVQPERHPKVLKTDIDPILWSSLLGNHKRRRGLISTISVEDWLTDLTHPEYQPLAELISQLAAFLVVDSYWLPVSDVRNQPEYLIEAFQLAAVPQSSVRSTTRQLEMDAAGREGEVKRRRLDMDG
ncbi:hypothetical protein BGW80DRAFT_63086 [Lactifluus volemus]|nr:hypothetical protein BGW80DRAFT_63086 [Lactifluus volemus]